MAERGKRYDYVVCSRFVKKCRIFLSFAIFSAVRTIFSTEVNFFSRF